MKSLLMRSVACSFCFFDFKAVLFIDYGTAWASFFYLSRNWSRPGQRTIASSRTRSSREWDPLPSHINTPRVVHDFSPILTKDLKSCVLSKHHLWSCSGFTHGT